MLQLYYSYGFFHLLDVHTYKYISTYKLSLFETVQPKTVTAK